MCRRTRTRCRQPDGQGIAFKRGALGILQRRELLRVASELEGVLSKAFVEPRPGATVEGKLTRRVELSGGRFALVERSREFTLVPWRPVLERQLGNRVAGIMRADGVNWQFGRSRQGPGLPTV